MKKAHPARPTQFMTAARFNQSATTPAQINPKRPKKYGREEKNPIFAQEKPRATLRYWGSQDMMPHHMLTEAQKENAQQQKSGFLISKMKFRHAVPVLNALSVPASRV